MAAKRKRSKKSIDMRVAKHYKMFFLVGIVLGLVGIFADMTIVWWAGLMLLLMGMAYKKKLKPIDPKEQKRLMIFVAIAVIVLVIGVFALFLMESAASIDSFEECIAAGYPAMESYPRQCRACSRTFTEEI